MLPGFAAAGLCKQKKPRFDEGGADLEGLKSIQGLVQVYRFEEKEE